MYDKYFNIELILIFIYIFELFLLKYMSFFFNYTATIEIYTLSLHDALPIYRRADPAVWGVLPRPEAGQASRLARCSAVSGCRPSSSACRLARIGVQPFRQPSTSAGSVSRSWTRRSRTRSPGGGSRSTATRVAG